LFTASLFKQLRIGCLGRTEGNLKSSCHVFYSKLNEIRIILEVSLSMGLEKIVFD
jgi:hypothetical protein